MPVRIGFTQFRRQMLEKELDNITWDFCPSWASRKFSSPAT